MYRLMCRFRSAAAAVALVGGISLYDVPSARAVDCTITFSLDTNVTLAGMGVTVGYSQAGGSWPIVDLIYGSSCEPIGNYILIGTADDFSKTLSMTYQTVGPEQLDGPTDFARCAYTRAGTAPSASDFDVTTTQAFKAGGIPVTPLPQTSISDISCEGGGPTTTQSTLPPTTTTTTLANGGVCGDPVDPPLVGGGQAAFINATDALFALRAAVGLESCALCVCDLDNSGAVSASDALALLLLAVGQPGNLDCPPCS